MAMRAVRTILNLSPYQFGVDNAPLNASTTSATVPIGGANQLVLHIEVTNVTGAALAVSFYPQIKTPPNADWESMVTKEIVAGVETMSVRQEVCPTTAAVAGTYVYEFPMSISGQDGSQFRITTLTAAGAGATDLVSIRCQVGHSGV